MTPFVIEPVEGVFFGPPRSTHAEDSHWAEGVFPPHTAFQGMIRTRLLDAAGLLDEPSAKAIAAAVGTADELPEGWQIQGPFPCERVGDLVVPWLPRPWFVQPNGSEDPSGWLARGELHVPAEHQAFDDLEVPARRVLGRTEPPTSSKRSERPQWIHPADLERWLGGDGREWRPDRESGDRLPPFVRWESQSGVVIGDQGLVEPSQLYALEALRFRHGCGLYGAVEGLEPPLSGGALHSGRGAAGRKGRLALFSQPEEVHPAWKRMFDGQHLPADVEDGALVWMCSLTAAEVRDPWVPLRDGPVVAEPVAIRLRPPVVIGGLDMASGRARPNRSLRPGGSAWLLRISGGDAAARARALRTWNGAHHLGRREDRPFGYGQVLLSAPLRRNT